MIPAGFKPISKAPVDRPILAYFNDHREPKRRYVVMYFDEEAYLWRTTYGHSFIGAPTHFKELYVESSGNPG